MQGRAFGRTGRQVSELGVGMWGMGAWSGSDDDVSLRTLQSAVDRGVTFLDTALAYGDGHSERLLGRLVRANPDRPLFTATKIPPANRRWPALATDPLEVAFPPNHIRRSVEQSLANLGLPSVDLIQFHVWNDAWALDGTWQRAVDDLRREGLVRFVGISINRWEPANAIRTVRSGLVDAVQVVYNVFEQRPEDELFPACREAGVAVIARVPFDEGSLTGTLTPDSRWPDTDFRAHYFSAANLAATLPRVEALRPFVPAGETMAQLAIRFVLSHPDVTTVIPGMRRLEHLDANLAAADAGRLPDSLLSALRAHRWDRDPADVVG